LCGQLAAAKAGGRRHSLSKPVLRHPHGGCGASAILAWDTDRYYGSTPVGQPVLMLTKPVAPGDEITVDYGPNFAYQKHGFSRNTSGAKRSRIGASSTPSSAYLATPSVMTAITIINSGHDLPW
jgi:hypothetical protein